MLFGEKTKKGAASLLSISVRRSMISHLNVNSLSCIYIASHGYKNKLGLPKILIIILHFCNIINISMIFLFS